MKKVTIMENKKLTFREAMNRLEEIVAQLNSDTLELEQAMDLFKEGLALSSQCEGQLKHFQQEMDQLMKQQEQNNG